MPVIHGKNGKVKFSANAIAEITRIRVNETVPFADSTAMGDTAQTHNVGVPTWTAEVECRYDPADTNGQATVAIGASVTIGFYTQGDVAGRTYRSGTATIVGTNEEGTFTENVTFSFQLQGNGALAKGPVSG